MSAEPVTLSTAELHALAVNILVAHNTSAANAKSVADALIAAEVDGQKGHGASRLPSYAAQAKSGKVDGHAAPRVVSEAAGAVRIDVANGFAYPAMELARRELAERIKNCGIAAASLFRSHHFGQAGYHVEQVAEQGFIGLAFGNSPKAIAPWGGNQGLFGTNPIAFAAPRRQEAPLVIDLSLSKVARGKVMVAAKEGRAIPEGWALDADGNATTDPQAAMAGTMVPMGDAKGAALVLMVEILAAALTGAHFGYEASSFFTADGAPPGVGQTLLALDPSVLSGGTFDDRLELLISAILAQDGTRLPGSRRLNARNQAAENGIELSGQLFAELSELAGA